MFELISEDYVYSIRTLWTCYENVRAFLETWSLEESPSAYADPQEIVTRLSLMVAAGARDKIRT